MTLQPDKTVEALTGLLPERTRKILGGEWSLQSRWAGIASVAWSCYGRDFTFEQFTELVWQSDLGQSYFAKENFKTRQQFDKNLRGAWDSDRFDWGYKDRAVRERLNAVLGAVQSAAWPGRGGSSERAVAMALLTLGHELNRYTVDATVRELAGRSGFGVRAVSGALKRLAAKGLFTLRASESREHSTRNYRINLDWKPVVGNRETYKVSYPPTTLYVPLLLTTVHPCWSPQALGPSARRLWEALSEAPDGAKVKALVSATGMSRKTVQTHLARMVGHGLLTRAGDRNAVFAVSAGADLGAVAAEYGAEDWHDRRAERFERERAGYREVQRKRASGQKPVEDASRGFDSEAQALADREQTRQEAREVLSVSAPPAWAVASVDELCNPVYAVPAPPEDLSGHDVFPEGPFAGKHDPFCGLCLGAEGATA
jgi:DNA-binding MarR family transcriptional regulator